MIAILPVIFLIVTGLLLEYRERLELHEIYPENAVVLWLYGSEQQQGGDFTAEAGYDEAGYIDEGYSEEPATYEKVLTAFHAGRFRGKDTRFLLVISAFTLLALSLTGPFLWVRRMLFKKPGESRKTIESRKVGDSKLQNSV